MFTPLGLSELAIILLCVVLLLFGLQLSSHRFIKDAVNLIVRISMKFSIYHIKERKCLNMSIRFTK